MKKKIAHVIVTPTMAGAQKISYEILKGLPDSEYEKYLICGVDKYIENADFFNKFRAIGVHIIKVKNLKRDVGYHDFRCFIELLRVFKKERFDIVHTHSTKPGILARISAKIALTPKVIHTVHGISFHKYEKLSKRIVYFAIEYIASFFSNSIITVNKNYIKYYKSIPSVSVGCIYNGVDFKSLIVSQESENIKSANSKKSVSILFLARFDDQKNPLLLIKAIEKVCQIGILQHKIEVIMVGDGPLLDCCKSYVKDIGLVDVVSFYGWCDDVSKKFNQADIFCVPSNYEAFGLVFVEAGYFGLPCISTNVEGIPEVISHQKTGLLCEPNNVQALSDCIIKLVNDDFLRKELGEAARIKALQFSVTTMVEKYISVYES